MELPTRNVDFEAATAPSLPDAGSGPSLSNHTIPSGFSRPHPAAAESFRSDISTDRPVRPRQRPRWRGGLCDGSTTVSYFRGGIAIAASVGSLIYGLVGLIEYFTHRQHPVYPTAAGTVHPILAVALEAEMTVTIASASGCQSVALPSTVQAAITTGLQEASGREENEWNAESAVNVI